MPGSLLTLLVLGCVPTRGESGGEGSSRCGPAPWGHVAGTLFVDAHTAVSGDGSATAPFRTIGQAIDAAGVSDVIAVAAGTYVEPLASSGADLTIAGRCAERVTLAPPASDVDEETSPAALSFGTSDTPETTGALVLSGLTLDAGGARGLEVRGGSVTLDDVVLTGHRGAALALREADATLTDVVIRDPVPGEGELRPGMFLSDSQLTGQRVSVQGAEGYGLLLFRDTDLHLVDSEVLDTRVADDLFGQSVGAALVANSSRVVLEDVRVAGAVGAGVVIQDGSHLDFDGLVIEDVTSSTVVWNVQSPALFAGLMFPLGEPSGAPDVIDGRDLVVRRADMGVWAYDTGSIRLIGAELTDLGQQTTMGGLLADSYGRIEAEGVRIERARGAAVMAFWDGEVVLRDAEILDVQLGAGLPIDGATADLLALGAVTDGGHLTLERTTIRGAAGSGIDASDQGWGPPTLTLRDVVIEDVLPPRNGRNAKGILLQAGSATVDGLTVRRVRGPGIAQGSWSEQASALSCSDCRFSQVALAGVLTTGTADGVEASLQDCTIEAVALEEASGLSTGILTTELSGPPVLSVDGCRVSGTAHAALFVSGDGAIDVRDSQLEGGAGASVQGLLDVHGNAVYATGIDAWNGATGLRLDGVALTPGAGPAVLLHDASATLSATDWSGGELRQQRCAHIVPLDDIDGAPIAVLCPDHDLPVVEVDPRLVGSSPIDLAL